MKNCAPTGALFIGCRKHGEFFPRFADYIGWKEKTQMTIELTESEVTSLKIALTASYAAFLGGKKEIVGDAKSEEQFLTFVGDIARVLFKLK